MPLWVVSMAASRGLGEFKHACGYAVTDTEAAALGHALIRARELMPERLGWTGHSVAAYCVPERDLRAALDPPVPA